ncbi:MAG: DegQ family serine endoprotease [Candidatus Eisenbacteria bacterium]
MRTEDHNPNGNNRFLAPILAGVAATAVLAALFAFFGTGAPAHAMDPDERAAIGAAKSLGKAFTAVSREVIPAVVTVTSDKVVRPAQGLPNNDMHDFFRFFGMPFGEDGGPEMVQRALGSGVIISEDGYIITNSHVVANAKEIAVILSDGEEYGAEVIGTDPKSDVAVIRIEGRNLPYAKLGDSDALEVGEWVLAVGSPFSQNLNHTVTAGIVSAKSRVAVGLADYEDFIQTDAAINPGNSGGALVNLDGEVVGINAAIASRSGGSQGVGFAIPINMVTRIKDALIQDGAVTRGWIGIGIQEVSREIQDALDLPDKNGVLISNVMDDSPAAEAKLERQDVIVSLNGRKVESMRTFRNEIADTPPGSDVRLGILRKGKTIDKTVTLGRLPGEEEPAPAIARAAGEKLGIDARALDAETRGAYGIERSGGVVVTGVRRGSPAAREGVREGDMIVSLNEQEIESMADYGRAMDALEEGEVALFLVERGGSTFFVGVRVPKE